MKIQHARYIDGLPHRTRVTVTVTPEGGSATGDNAGVSASVNSVGVFLPDDQSARNGVVALISALREVADTLEDGLTEFE